MANKKTLTPWCPAAARDLLRAGLVAPLLLSLIGCTELTRWIARPEAQPASPAQPTVAAQPAPEPEPAPIPAPQEKPKPGKLYEWDGKGRKLSRIVIDTNEQKARFYVQDEQVGWTTVASGVKTHPTPKGHFEVLEKVANKRSNLYGKVYGKGGQVLSTNAKAGKGQFPAGARFEGASMPYFLRLTHDGVGLHAGPIPRPGSPASHGCIRLPAKLAPVLFEHVGVGTQVSIVGSGPDYGNYVAKQRAAAAQMAAQRAARERERQEVAARAKAAGLDGGVPASEPAAEPVQAAATAAEVTSESRPRPRTSTARPRQPADGAAPPRRRVAAAPVARSEPSAIPQESPEPAPAVTTVAQSAPPQAPSDAPAPADQPGSPETRAVSQNAAPEAPADRQEAPAVPSAPTLAQSEPPPVTPVPAAAEVTPKPPVAVAAPPVSPAATAAPETAPVVPRPSPVPSAAPPVAAQPSVSGGDQAPGG